MEKWKVGEGIDRKREEEKIRKEKILREIRRKFSGEMRGGR